VNTSELLMLAARAGVKFWLDGDRLAYRAPKGGMTDSLREEVISHKAELIAMLQRDRLDVVSPISRTALSELNWGPLASGQERLWLIERRTGASPLYNVHFRLQWKGVLDREILTLSLRDTVASHAAMRTTFTEFDGAPRATVSPDADVELVHLDLRGQGPEAQASEAEEFILAHQRAPFDLERGPLMRTAVVTLADDDHILLVTQHHIVTDGWSVGIFLTELVQGYRARCLGQNPARPEPSLSYLDYVRWQHQWRGEQLYQQRLAWWKEHLAGLAPLELPRDRRIVPGVPDYSGAAAEFSVPAALAARLKDLAGQEQCTLYTVLLTAWAILLHRYASQCDFAVGTVTSGRDRRELQKLIGFFVNTLVVRCDLSGDPSVAQAITRVRVETESVFEREVPFADVVLAAGVARDVGLTPLIQAAFIFGNIPMPDVLNAQDAARISASVRLDSGIGGSVEGMTKFDLALFMRESSGGISGCLEYATAQFDASAVQRLAEHFLILLQSIVQNPHETVGRLGLISTQERQQLLVEWNDTSSPQLNSGH
jgi:Condensation domain/TubC N-terminal docking domain